MQKSGAPTVKRIFTDLHLKPNITDRSQTNMMIEKAAELGYALISIPISPDLRPEETNQLKENSRASGVDFASRVDLRPRTEDQLLGMLRKLRRKFEIVCVACETKEVARQAAKDHRVDLLSFPLLDYTHRFLDRAEAELASGSNSAIEVDIKPLLLLEGPGRIRFLSSLRREIAIAQEFHLPIVISSGVSDPIFLRKPREMAQVTTLFGLNDTAALDAISTNPVQLVERNRGKLDAKYVAPGIRLVKQGGKDEAA
jgi:ribonuclease P/MRP protein subunit RPP1